ncbi:MAG: DUF4112 domain-containing protein [Pseudomonadota bacterium]
MRQIRPAHIQIETFPPGPIRDRLVRIERLADWLDTRFQVPGLGWRIGADAILGFVPVVGDLLSTAISGYLILEAHRLGVSRQTRMRMGLHMGVDWAIGLVPVVGDLLDIFNRSNARNARILAEELRRMHGETH